MEQGFRGHQQPQTQVIQPQPMHHVSITSLFPQGAYSLTATLEPVFYSNSSVIVTAISGVAYLFISYDSVHPSEYKSKLQMRKYGKKCRNKRTFCEKYE